MGFEFRCNGTQLSALSTGPHYIHMHPMFLLYYSAPYMLYTPFTLPSFIVIPFCIHFFCLSNLHTTPKTVLNFHLHYKVFFDPSFLMGLSFLTIIVSMITILSLTFSIDYLEMFLFIHICESHSPVTL